MKMPSHMVDAVLRSPAMLRQLVANPVCRKALAEYVETTDFCISLLAENDSRRVEMLAKVAPIRRALNGARPSSEFEA